jgi:2-hydroxychromene-2-carboxylate isomerase
MDLHFYYDVVCPYAYIASTQVEALARAAGARLIWHPVLLGGIYRAVEASQDPGGDMPVAKARHNLLDMHRQAERAGIELHLNPRHPQRSVEAMRLLTAADEAVRPALTHALYRHYHVEHGDLGLDGLAPIARAFGVDPESALRPEVKQALQDSTAEAVARGAFGVPTFVVGDRLWWGADRLAQVAAALGSSWPSPPVGPPRPGAKLRFFHDLASPFSYLASTRVQALAEAAGAELTWHPMLLGAVFREIGTPMVPIAAMSEAKRIWMGRDLFEHAARLGVELHWPRTFPINTIAALRVTLVEPATIAPLYRAIWAHDRNVGDLQILTEVLSEAGFDGPGLLAATGDPAIKQSLKDHTDEAIARGVCGAPSFLVDDQLLFWGQDRMDMVDAALRGWRPQVG